MAVDPLTLECFLEYGIGMSFLFLRFFSRIRTFGFRHFELEDLFTALAIVSLDQRSAGSVFNECTQVKMTGILFGDDSFDLLAEYVPTRYITAIIWDEESYRSLFSR